MEQKVIICDYALSNKSGTMYFTPMNTNIAAGYIDNEPKDGSYLVNITTIDEFCKLNNIKPNFIKMDIEGAELDAIIGSKSTILEYKPKLAICIYHRFSHRWEIPLLIHEILPEYKFYIKKSQPRGETVLFCIAD